MPTPDPEIAAQICKTASSLRRSLERELNGLESHSSDEAFRELYDTLYLPRLTALGRQAGIYVEHQDWHTLSEPLQSDLAGTQIRIVIGLLWTLMTSL